jgi:hypothetical protein
MGRRSPYQTDPTRTVAYGNLDELMVYVWADRAVTDEVFRSYLTGYIEFVESCGPITAQLTVSPSFAPSLRQRGILNENAEAIRLGTVRAIALVSDSVVARGVLTSMAWAFPDKKRALKAFGMTELGLAGTWLASQGVRAPIDAIVTLLNELRGELA